jgi:4-hydroxythreonine-4-phosphate dehydrogenase
VDNRPIVGITVGDPAGIGPEIVLKALTPGAGITPGADELYRLARPLVVGDLCWLREVAAALSIPVRTRAVANAAAGAYEPGVIDVLDMPGLDTATLKWGVIQPEAGRAAFSYIRRAINLANAGQIDAVATAPVNKEALRAGGVPFLDHTAMFTELTASHDVLTMFVVGALRIFFATRHMSLLAACRDLTAEGVAATAIAAHAALRGYEIADARLALAALNPHAGEGGMFGDEEIRVLQPAVAQVRARGISISEPIAADSVFHLARQGRFDAVIALYHDQGHIAAKMVDFERTVAITTGLPFVRASVDHGTGFDIAGQGVASAVSMAESIRAAAEYTGKGRQR